MEKTKLEIGNFQNIILILGKLYSPTDAASEFFANSMDAHAKNIEISLGKDSKGSYIVFSDDGDGMDQSDLYRVAKNIGNSIKQIEADKNAIGQFGIGILGFVTFGDEMHIVSRKNSSDVLSELTIKKGDIECIIENSKRKNLRISKEQGTDVYIYYGKPHILGHHLANQISQKYRHRLINNPINAVVKSGRNKEYEIKALLISGATINKQIFKTLYGKISFNIILSSSESSNFPIKVIRKGTVICNLKDIAEFNRHPWNNPRLTGEVIFDAIEITSSRNQILLNNPQYEVFKQKVLFIEKSIESYLEELKKARFESLDSELRTHLNNLIKQALAMLSDQIELLDRKLPSSEKYKNPILNIPEAKEVGFPINGEGLIKFIDHGEVNENETEPVHNESTKPSKKEITNETTLEDFDVSNIESPPQVYKPKIKPGFNWDFDSERFQDEPWKMSKYDAVLNTIIINDNHLYWHNIRNLSDETLKYRLKWDYIVSLTLKEIILFNLQRESNPFAAQFDNNMELYIRFLVKIRELQGR